MKLGTLTIESGKFRLPCVYEFLRNDTVLYVGRSDRGFSRAFTSKKQSEKRTTAFRQADQIRVTVFDNVSETRTEERRLIRLYNPAANIQYNPKATASIVIPGNTRQYVIDTLRFAPVGKRELDRHMRRRPDYGPVILDLMARGEIEITGSGKRGSPVVFRIRESQTSTSKNQY